MVNVIGFGILERGKKVERGVIQGKIWSKMIVRRLGVKVETYKTFNSDMKVGMYDFKT